MEKAIEHVVKTTHSIAFCIASTTKVKIVIIAFAWQERIEFHIVRSRDDCHVNGDIINKLSLIMFRELLERVIV